MMKPSILNTFPSNGANGIPIGESIIIVLDRSVDLATLRSNVVLYGQDFDHASGPDSARWIDQKTSANPLFLKSPGFKGTVECDYKQVYVLGGEILDPQPQYSSYLEESAAGVEVWAIIRPKTPLAPLTEHTLYVVGDPEGVGRGLASRTVYDPIWVSGPNTSTGTLSSHGTYSGEVPYTVIVKVTKAGGLGTAKYKWWYQELGEASATLDRTTNRKPRRIDDGVEVSFSDGEYEVGETYSFTVTPPEYLEDSFQLVFQTNDGSFTAAPESPSTFPEAISSIEELTNTEDSRLQVLEMVPRNASSNQLLQDRKIRLTFSKDLDPSTITSDSVRVFLYPVSGVYSDTHQQTELVKKLTVDGATLLIEV